MRLHYQNFLIRHWQASDRQVVAQLIRSVLAEYQLDCEPEAADWDVLHVEAAYEETGGEFWVVEQDGTIVGTAAYYPVARGENAVELRKMYLLPAARGVGLGRYLLTQLEQRIVERGYAQIWLETASVLTAAVKLYERNGYQPSCGVHTARCDRVYTKLL